ncbi:2-acyl-glycerophospho-ethanolamine acyltransferase [[Bacillus] enclensis]|uniref:2-acyl-glycerophospho-ethanolamine acyltransferase n=1 Tax=[Bacillus] enclensis TaxID=1402860 RepID=UPI0018DC0F09|nr:2-acyl-glycerophospho-ethanolamine acyltransferase [[Bacillus] enclensis]MBH9964926.1 2-acyl-glycerophospho-ethanolamine acyltransferase [[Bacillus] enclensis]
MDRNKLRIFTTISFSIAIVTIVVIPVTIYASGPNDMGTIAFLLSVAGIPLSIVSMFSKENIVKRIVALIVNLMPLSLFAYAFVLELADEFFRSAP